MELNGMMYLEGCRISITSYSNAMEITLELTCCKHPPASTLPRHWKDNKDALINYMEQVHTGVKGQVLDREGRPVMGAKVQVEGINKHVTTTRSGEYWRLLAPGNYRIRAVSPEGESRSVDVMVRQGQSQVAMLTINSTRKKWILIVSPCIFVVM